MLRIFYCIFGNLKVCSTEKSFQQKESADQQGHLKCPDMDGGGGGEIHLKLFLSVIKGRDIPKHSVKNLTTWLL